MTCPLCTTPHTRLIETPVPGGPDGASVALCSTCADQVSSETQSASHFRALGSTMWSEDPAVQVLAARMLAQIPEIWANDLADQLYLDDDTRAWAENVPRASDHKDSNGQPLAAGDTVVLVKDLPVKGGGLRPSVGRPFIAFRLSQIILRISKGVWRARGS
jgi:protein PhnA